MSTYVGVRDLWSFPPSCIVTRLWKWAWCFRGMLGTLEIQLSASKMHITKSITPRTCERNAYQYEPLSVLIKRTKTSRNLDVLWFSSLSTSCLITSLCNEVSSRFHPTALPIIIRATSNITHNEAQAMDNQRRIKAQNQYRTFLLTRSPWHMLHPPIIIIKSSPVNSMRFLV